MMVTGCVVILAAFAYVSLILGAAFYHAEAALPDTNWGFPKFVVGGFMTAGVAVLVAGWVALLSIGTEKTQDDKINS